MDDGIKVVPFEVNSGNRTYLITYSMLDHNIFPTRALFGYACVASFGGNNVEYFCVGKEMHENGLYHYHAALKLTKVMRWKAAKQFLTETFNVTVNFAPAPYEGMYSGAFRYATKADGNKAFYGHCTKKHPNLDMIGKNKVPINANLAYRHKRRREGACGGDNPVPTKHKRVTKGDVATFIINTKIKSELELMNSAKERRDAGDPALNDFVFGMQRKSRCELVEDAWRMENASDMLKDQDVDRMRLVEEHASRENCLCDGLWLKLALNVLDRNSIDRNTFSCGLRTAMSMGRVKEVNILLVGRADCGKSFLLQPITNLIPNTFQNPAKSVFGWLGVDKANAIFLNDLRWFPPKIPGYFVAWDDMLKLLEGAQVRLPAPMNVQSNHIEVVKKMPIFATSICEIKYYISNVNEPQTDTHIHENEMMDARWNIFFFTYRLKKEEKVRNVPECTTCFSKLVLGQF